jgi:hypothetical protein
MKPCAVALALAPALAGCGGHAAPRSPARAPAASLDRSLDPLIVGGMPATFDDACYAGAVWGAVDGDIGRERLDAAFAKAVANADDEARDSVCSEPLAIARIRRAARTHTLDLAAELGHAVPRAREIAARYAGIATEPLDTAAATKLRGLLDDPDSRVRIAAHDAVAARHDRDAIPVLQQIAARHDDGRALACATLRKLDAPGDCEPSTDSDSFGFGMMTGEGAPHDFCGEAHANIAAPDIARQREGMLFFASEQFDAGNKGLVFLPEAHVNDCLLAPGDRERMLHSPDNVVRALAAVTTAWAR